MLCFLLNFSKHTNEWLPPPHQSAIGNHRVLSGAVAVVIISVIGICGWFCVCVHARLLGWGEGEREVHINKN